MIVANMALSDPFQPFLARTTTDRINALKTNTKTFYEAFRTMNRFFRAFGYSFLSLYFSPSGPQIRCNRRGPYIIYFVLTWALIIGVFNYTAYMYVAAFKKGEVFENILIACYYIRTVSIQVGAMFAIVTKAPKMRKLVRKLGGLEAALLCPTSLNKASRNVIALNLIYSVVGFLSTIPLILYTRKLSNSQFYWNIIFVVLLFYEQTSCMITYSWNMFFSKVFAEFINSINRELREMGSRKLFLARRDLRDVHGLFLGVIEAFEQCNSLLGPWLVVDFSLNLLTAAPWCYSLIRNAEHLMVVLVHSLGFLVLCAQMTIVAIYSMHPSTKAKKTWNLLTKLLVSREHSPSVQAKIQQFRHTCQNQDFCFSGCGFFKVAPPLIVSIASSIITYTVILYQTDNMSPSNAALNVTNCINSTST